MIPNAFKAAILWGLKPAEFWSLHPVEFWWMSEAKKPVKMYGSMTENEAAEIYRQAYGDDNG